jgi:putative acetyltransferase
LISIKRVSPDHPDFRQLIELLDQDLWARYPDTQHLFHGFNIVKLDVKVVVAYDGETAVGCGCFRETVYRDTVEIKRMFVHEDARRKGVAKLILGELERWALEEGFNRAILETGIKQPEAIALYKRIGYEQIDNYEPYVGSEDSVCMGKDL